jgi:hypothetical protein
MLGSKWFIGILLPVILALITLHFNKPGKPPVFVISQQLIKHSEPIVIKAGNDQANRPRCLNVMFDDRLFEKQAFPKPDDTPQNWLFKITDQNYSPGKHRIRVGFPGDIFSEECVIEFKHIEARFIVVNPILRNDAVMKIKTEDGDIDVSTALYVEFDSVVFPDSAIPVESSGPQHWHFNLRNMPLTEEMKENGNHIIRLRFPGENFSKEHTIKLFTQDIVVNTQLTMVGKEKKFKGKTAGKKQIEDNEFTVDVIFYHEGHDKEINVKTNRKKDDATGVIYYDFETSFSGFPDISPDDERYGQPFFEFRISDKAGNQFKQRQSYAQFIAPGDTLTASNDWVDIDVKKNLPKDLANGILKNLFSIRPTTPSTGSDYTSIHLTVTCMTKNIRHLKWDHHITNTMTLIFRDGDNIETTFENEFIDKTVMSEPSVSYSVAQKNETGKMIISNTVRSDALIGPLLTIRSNVRNDMVFIDGKECGPTRLDKILPTGKHTIRVEKKGYTSFEKQIDLQKDKIIWARLHPFLRSKPETLSDDKVKQILGDTWYPKTTINNNYKDKKDGTIIDHSTWLMWQKEGSDQAMSFKNSKAYISHLNQTKFGGYDDWRLPTLKELISLLEVKKSSNGFYIDSVFSKKQQWCWSADIRDSGGAFYVVFYDGRVGWYDLSGNSYVRAVRSFYSDNDG